ncbi:MAG: RnfABCDGE type electron transport complex subunit G [Lachnospiraceae bacterium]|nr:RnfABCDGE type electron transport complex subunit G [Lachnospiraceae bacterium]
MKNITGMLKDAMIILVITLFAGLILGFVYQITKEPIALAEEKAAKEAYAEVFPGATDFVMVKEGMPEGEFMEGWIKAGYETITVDNVLEAVDEGGNVLGNVLTVTTSAGYGGNITITMGLKNDGTLNGISILSIAETAGLGMKAEDVLKPQFANKQVASFTYTKSGSTMDSEIDAISGATITTDALTTAVNGGLYYFQMQLGGSGNETK